MKDFKNGQCVKFIPTGETGKISYVSENPEYPYVSVIFDNEPAWIAQPIALENLSAI